MYVLRVNNSLLFTMLACLFNTIKYCHCTQHVYYNIQQCAIYCKNYRKENDKYTHTFNKAKGNNNKIYIIFTIIYIMLIVQIPEYCCIVLICLWNVIELFILLIDHNPMLILISF